MNWECYYWPSLTIIYRLRSESNEESSEEEPYIPQKKRIADDTLLGMIKKEERKKQEVIILINLYCLRMEALIISKSKLTIKLNSNLINEQVHDCYTATKIKKVGMCRENFISRLNCARYENMFRLYNPLHSWVLIIALVSSHKTPPKTWLYNRKQR